MKLATQLYAQNVFSFIKTSIRGVRLVLIILVLGLILRMYNYPSYSFAFDQVQILENVSHIVQGDLTLVGPRTGPAQMFTGPLIYYLTVPFFLIFREWSVVVVPNVLACVTGLCIFFLFRKYWGEDQAFVSLAIWAFSPFFISLDRVFWNPNLSLLYSACVLVTVLFFSRKSQTNEHGRTTNQWWGIGLVGFGSFLSYQAHFSGLLLPVLVAVAVLFFKRPKKYLVASIAGTVISLIPTVVFDMRHDWINLRGLYQLLTTGSGFSIDFILVDIGRNLFITLENIGKIFLLGNHLALILILGLLTVGLSVLGINQKTREQSKLVIAWLVLVAILFSFYSGGKPEYYFIITFPAVLILVLIVLFRLNQQQKIVSMMVFGLYSAWFIKAEYSSNFDLSIGNSLQVRQYIEKVSQETDLSMIVYDIDDLAHDTAGLRYLLADTFSDGKQPRQGKLLHIAFPGQVSYSNIKYIGKIAIWVDPRTEEDVNYLTESAYIIGTPEDVLILENKYHKDLSKKSKVYQVIREGIQVGTLEVYQLSDEVQREWHSQCDEISNSLEDGWRDQNWIQGEGENHFYILRDYCFRYTVSQGILDLSGQDANIVSNFLFY